MINKEISRRTPEAAGFDLTAQPQGKLSIDFQQRGAQVSGGQVGDVIALFVPAQLTKRRVYVFLYTQASVNGTEIRGSVDFYFNKSKVGSLPVKCDSVSAVGSANIGLSIGSNISDIGQAVIPNAMLIGIAAAQYAVNPYEVDFQCDEVRLNFSLMTLPGATTQVFLAVYSE